jgi:hypothetical protein
MKLNESRQLVAYVGDNTRNSFGDNMNNTHRNTETLTGASKEFGLEVKHRCNMAQQLFNSICLKMMLRS